MSRRPKIDEGKWHYRDCLNSMLKECRDRPGEWHCLLSAQISQIIAPALKFGSWLVAVWLFKLARNILSFTCLQLDIWNFPPIIVSTWVKKTDVFHSPHSLGMLLSFASVKLCFWHACLYIKVLRHIQSFYLPVVRLFNIFWSATHSGIVHYSSILGIWLFIWHLVLLCFWPLLRIFPCASSVKGSMVTALTVWKIWARRTKPALTSRWNLHGMLLQ